MSLVFTFLNDTVALYNNQTMLPLRWRRCSGWMEELGHLCHVYNRMAIQPGTSPVAFSHLQRLAPAYSNALEKAIELS